MAGWHEERLCVNGLWVCVNSVVNDVSGFGGGSEGTRVRLLGRLRYLEVDKRVVPGDGVNGVWLWWLFFSFPGRALCPSLSLSKQITEHTTAKISTLW